MLVRKGGSPATGGTVKPPAAGGGVGRGRRARRSRTPTANAAVAPLTVPPLLAGLVQTHHPPTTQGGARRNVCAQHSATRCRARRTAGHLFRAKSRKKPTLFLRNLYVSRVPLFAWRNRSETRNSKLVLSGVEGSETNSKHEFSNAQNPFPRFFSGRLCVPMFRTFRRFGFRICFGFRISSFGFRMSGLLGCGREPP